MKASEVREKYLKFFESKGHKRIDPAPLVLENDPTTLFTSSGMQPLVPYLMGETHSEGDKLVNSQPSIRLGDIEEVGDNRHTTFFEMLGNWGLGSYFKEQQLSWLFSFLYNELKLNPTKLYVSVFKGNDVAPPDKESVDIWKNQFLQVSKDFIEIGIKEVTENENPHKGMKKSDRIFYYGVEKNWWSRSGTPDQMPVGEIGGPDSEVFYDFGEELKIHESSQWRNKPCHPNCDCGRFIEIGNSVFIQYVKQGDGFFKELPQKNVDFGGGLERITAATENTPDIFNIDVFQPLIMTLELYFGIKYGSRKETDEMYRVVAEHTRAAVFLIKSGVRPGNKLQDYILRRLIRRAVAKTYIHDKNFDSKNFKTLVGVAMESYSEQFDSGDKKVIEDIFSIEVRKFRATIERGLRELVKQAKISGDTMFNLLQTYGFPPEITKEIAGMENISMDKNVDEDFEKLMKAHKEKSRTTSAGVFKGGLADQTSEVVKLHTATHLLLASLRKVLGDQVVQKGQNITKERTRFDFPHPKKLTDEELKEVEDIINDVIKKDLPVGFKVMPKDEAVKTGAIHAFNEKYADTVKVYYVGESLMSAFSKEFCGGPHVSRTGEIGHVTIIKQEKVGSGLMRIYAKSD